MYISYLKYNSIITYVGNQSNIEIIYTNNRFTFDIEISRTYIVNEIDE